MKNLIIREAEIKDIEEMARLDEICFADPWSIESFRIELEENGKAMYQVAELDGQVVAYAGLWEILDEGHITNVAVSPDFRGQKIGEKVVGNLLDSAREKGMTSFTLEVRESNLPAQQLYEKYGFKPAGIRKGYYLDNGENALIMWKHAEN